MEAYKKVIPLTIKPDLTSNLKPPIECEPNTFYCGQWSGEIKKGCGWQLWPDGSFYEGLWDKNMYNGFGRLIHSDGTIY